MQIVRKYSFRPWVPQHIPNIARKYIYCITVSQLLILSLTSSMGPLELKNDYPTKMTDVQC